jgi:hypothetical protein
LGKVAAKHGIFVVQDDKGVIDFIDVTTGKSLGLWYPKPNGWFVFNDVTHGGSPTDALRAIVAPYDLGR